MTASEILVNRLQLQLLRQIQNEQSLASLPFLQRSFLTTRPFKFDSTKHRKPPLFPRFDLRINPQPPYVDITRKHVYGHLRYITSVMHGDKSHSDRSIRKWHTHPQDLTEQKAPTSKPQRLFHPDHPHKLWHLKYNKKITLLYYFIQLHS
jgi:hypothetical protein